MAQTSFDPSSTFCSLLPNTFTMKFVFIKALVYIGAILGLSSLATGEDAGVFSYLRTKYDDLPEKGKFATGAAIGFGGSRIAIKSAVSVVKVAGAAFIATEVMNAAGVLDDIPSFSEEQTEMAETVKRRALTYASDFRNTLRKRLNPENIKTLMETDRMATMGAAAGAFVGFLL